MYINNACVGYENDGVTPLSFECWKNVWVNGNNAPGCSTSYQNCGEIYKTLIFNGPNSINQTIQLQSQKDFTTIYDNYIAGITTGVTHDITIPGLPNYDIMQEGILDACNQLPGTCIPASNKYVILGSNSVGYTRDQISNNSGLLNFYGCVSPNLTEPPQAANNLNGAKQCDPLCNRIDTIKLYDPNGNLIECNKSVCIIDQVTIDAVNSSVGSINFSNVCNNCGDTGCICIISGIDINVLWSEIPNANFSQDCGNQSSCYQTNDQNQLVPVDCTQTITNNNTPANDRTSIYILIGLFAFIILILIFLVVYYN